MLCPYPCNTLASALSPRPSLALAKALLLTPLSFLGLLLCVLSAQAQSGYPGGGSGYPGGGSGYPGGGGSPTPGHYWKVTYSSSGHVNYDIPNGYGGGTTPQSIPWEPTGGGGGTYGSDHINCDVLGTVTATLTWVPSAGGTLQSDPPSKMVSIVESGWAEESAGNWYGSGIAPTPAGSASDGLDDPPVPWNSGYISTGTHRIRKDGSSGTITLGPFTLTATCPVSSWWTSSKDLYYVGFSWDWMGGLTAVGFSATVVPPAHPVNFRCISASADSGGMLHYVYAWDSSTGNLADLAGCTIKERVSYENNVGGIHGVYENTGQTFYIPPFPFAGKFADPEIYGGTSGTKGIEADDHYVPSIPGSPTIPGLYQYGAYGALQDYIYTDDNSDSNNPNDYIVLRGPIDIEREVYAPGINWIYRITKYDAPEGSSKPYAEATLVLGPVHSASGP